MKQLCFFFLLLSCVSVATAALKITEVRTASNTVLVVVLSSTIEDVDGVNTELSSWKINGQEPQAINRYAMTADMCDHHVYLSTSELVAGTEYALKTPYGDTVLQFSDHQIFCESIKTNQVAYSALSKENYAIFAIWLGNGGGKKIEGVLPEYEVFEQYTDKIITSGTLTEIGENASSGDFVYRIDLSNVPEGGPYKIAVKGYGCSYPFGVGGVFSRRLAYIIFRGQYYQRCGCAIKAPYGMDIREKPCHATVYKVNGPIGEANITVGGDAEPFACYGGYHDAGDADRRAYHMANPIINMMIYEAFPELFTDGQFNVPDRFDEQYNIIGKGNGIPDIIDEAVWGTLIWEYLQNEDGSIQFGTETKGYPEPFAAPLDKDTKKYGTVKTDDRAAAVGAGLFMHLARMMRPYDTTYSNKLAERGERSFKYIGSAMADPEKLYYYVQKYLFDGDAAAHEQIKALKTVVDSYKDNLFTCHGYSLNNNKFDNPGYILSYIVEKNRPTDSSVVSYFKSAIKDAADVNIGELTKYAYPVGNNPTGTAWGHNIVQPFYACAPILQWRFSNEQRYLDGACNLMSYLLGLNPLGICYVTGLGFHQIHNPHDRESTYTLGKGWGPKPGITIFGPGVIQTFGGGSGPATFPELSTLPVERKFGDDMNSISTAEFTIFETMCHYALYTVLSGGGTWDETENPFSGQQVGVKDISSVRTARNAAPSVKVYMSSHRLTVEFFSDQRTRVNGSLFLTNGKKLLQFSTMAEHTGMNRCSVPFAVTSLPNFAGGVMLCRLIPEHGGASVVPVVRYRQ